MRYAMIGERLKAAGSQVLGHWEWTDDTKTDVRFPYENAQAGEWAVYLFIVDNMNFHPYYVGATTNLYKRMYSVPQRQGQASEEDTRQGTGVHGRGARREGGLLRAQAPLSSRGTSVPT